MDKSEDFFEEFYGKIDLNNQDTLMFEEKDESEDNPINNEVSFKLDMTAILKENENTNNHYRCSKCLFFPLIEIIDKNELKYMCKCTDFKRKIIKIKDLINEITNYEDEKNINTINKKKSLECKRHRKEFRYYCSNCRRNICKDCLEYHINQKHDFIIFDFNDYDAHKKLSKLIEYFNSKQCNNNQIKEKLDENENKNISELAENSSIFQEENNSDKLKNDKTSNQIIFENPNVITKENKPYYFYELFKIIYNDYINYPNYSHFFNIENMFRFIEKEMTSQNKNNDESEKDSEIEDKELKNTFKKGKDMMIISYKNDKNPIKLFGSKFNMNNYSNVCLEIDNKLLKLKESYEFNSNEEEVKIKLYISENTKTIDLSSMFSNCVNLKSIYGISKWQTKITNIDRLFYNCKSLSSLPDISEWDVSKLKNISYMFYNCYSLLEFPDLSKWITKNKSLVKNDNYIFIGFSFPNNFKEIKFMLGQKKESMVIIMKTLTGKIINLDVDPSDTIKTVKDLILKKEGFPPEQQRFIFGGRQLEDNNTLAQYNIKNQSTIHLIFKASFFKIFLKTLTGKIINLDVIPSDTIKTVKDLIFTKEGIPPEYQRFIFGGRQLEDNNTLARYNIKNQYTIQLIFNARLIQIFIQTLIGKTIELNVAESVTIKTVKDLIFKKEGIPPEQQIFTFEKKQLEDNKTLAECNIKNQSTIHLVIKKGGN